LKKISCIFNLSLFLVTALFVNVALAEYELAPDSFGTTESRDAYESELKRNQKYWQEKRKVK